MNAIAYQIHDSLYLNVTNRCTNHCGFCIRYKARQLNSKYPLWLEKEPTAEEIIAAIGDPKKYKEIVFCGYGEPLLRLETVMGVAKELKKQGVFIRLDTNGQANLFWGRNILPELQGLIDAISISLNAPDAATYNAICHPRFGEKAYVAVLEFIKEAKRYIPEVVATMVDLPNVDQAACKRIAEELGVDFRIRPYYMINYKP